MATASTTTVNNGSKPTSETVTEIPDDAQTIREQMLSTIRQSQEMFVDAAQSWVRALSIFPVPAMPAVPGMAAIPGVAAATRFTFDVATDLLSAQRDFALQLAKVFTPA
jgi:hypothetical protein